MSVRIVFSPMAGFGAEHRLNALSVSPFRLSVTAAEMFFELRPRSRGCLVIPFEFHRRLPPFVELLTAGAEWRVQSQLTDIRVRHLASYLCYEKTTVSVGRKR